MSRRFAVIAWLLLSVAALFGLGNTINKDQGAVSKKQNIYLAFTANEKGLHCADETGTPAAAYQSILSLIRRTYGNPIFVHLGNFLGPTPSTIVSKGKLDFQILDQQGYDLFHLSNHEFTIGAEELTNRINGAKTQVLRGNISMPGDPGKRWATVKRDERTVGFLGLTTDQFTNLVNESVRPNVSIETMADYANEAVQALDGKADVVVALTDLSDTEIDEARSIPGIDVIISSGGSSGTNSNEWLSIAFPGTNKSMVVRIIPDKSAIYVLELTLAYKSDQWKLDDINSELYTISASTPRDKALDAFVTKGVGKIRSEEATVVGQLASEISNENVRTQQSDFGKTMTNLLRDLTGADVAVINGGALRHGLPKGKVTDWDIINAMPFPSYFVVKRMSGSDISSILSKSNNLSGKGGYLQWSGLENMPEAGGDVINGVAIMSDRKYDVAMLDFLASGGDGYTEFQSAPTVKKLPAVGLQSLCFDYFKKYGTLILPDLKLSREKYYWYGSCNFGLGLNSLVADPDNATNYPDQSTFVAQQYILAHGTAGFSLNRKSYIYGFENSLDLQYGVNWDDDLEPSTSIDQMDLSSQLTLYMSHFIFHGRLALDPYVSGKFNTSIFYPALFDADAESDYRSGTLAIASGFQTQAFDFLTVKVGYNYELQPFNEADHQAKDGIEADFEWTWSVIPDLLSVTSSTAAITYFNWKTDGLSVSSKNDFNFAVGSHLSLVPSTQIYYDTVVNKIAYIVSTTLETSWAF